MAAPTRRERLRAATVDEIKQTARRLLVSDGPAAISLRAIARDMGMTAPALYRYVPSHEALMDGVCADLKSELIAELERARDAVPAERLGARIQATCRAFRDWAVGHPAEFSLMFASTTRAPDETPPESADWLGGAHGAHGVARHDAAVRFGRVFLDLIVELWRRRPFPVIDPEVFPAELRDQLERFVAGAELEVPIGVAYVFLSGWVRLYGLVALEVFGHLDFAVGNVEPLFEAEIGAMAAQLDLTLDG
ncbi:MAG: TetR/AcrR family transcriptional regulator [Micromonosporaceae bacterium]